MCPNYGPHRISQTEERGNYVWRGGGGEEEG